MDAILTKLGIESENAGGFCGEWVDGGETIASVSPIDGRPIAAVGQITPVQANIREPASVRVAVEGADAVVNLVAVLYEGGKQRFEALHVKGAETIAKAAQAGPGVHQRLRGTPSRLVRQGDPSRECGDV